MSTFLGAVNSASIQDRVDYVNALIRTAKEKGLMVTDNSSTWQTSYKYKPLKYTRGILYVSYEELDLYRLLKTGVNKWNKKSYKVGKDDIRAELSDIAKMHRSAIKRGY